jgi:hypothetical protein
VHAGDSPSPDGERVLRGELAAWLSQGRAAREVAAFASEEGAGAQREAVLVLLAT